MVSTVINDPWPHVIQDNFFDESLYLGIVKEIEDWVGHQKGKPTKGNRISILGERRFFSKNFPNVGKALRSIDFHSYLNKFKTVRDYHNLRTLKRIHEISILAGGDTYPIHDEAEYKLMSFVTYISPTQNRGTVLYDQNQKFVREVEWKPNRTLVFCGIAGKTWHSFDCDPDKYRITINTFLLKNGYSLKEGYTNA